MPALTKEIQERNEKIIDEVFDWYRAGGPKTEKVEDYYTRLSTKYGLSQNYIWHILRENPDKVLKRKSELKMWRVFRLMRDVVRSEGSKKDEADLLDQIRVEFEGNGKSESSSGNTHTNIIIIRESANNQAQEVSGRVSILRSEIPLVSGGDRNRQDVDAAA